MNEGILKRKPETVHSKLKIQNSIKIQNWKFKILSLFILYFAIVLIILHNLRSLHNVGSIFRTAEAAGCEKIYLAGITPEPLDRFGNYRLPLIKVSLGAEKNLKWEKIKSTISLVDKLKKQGFLIFAAEQDKKSIPYYSLKSKDFNWEKTALILGGEVKGLPPLVLNRADKILEIPLRGKKESLNVAVAFGIVVFNILHSPS